jgi:hypothetical protein
MGLFNESTKIPSFVDLSLLRSVEMLTRKTTPRQHAKSISELTAPDRPQATFETSNKKRQTRLSGLPSCITSLLLLSLS